MTINEALKIIYDADLFAESLKSQESAIIGGTEVFQELGFNIYKGAFKIYQENENWMLEMTGKGQVNDCFETNSLEDAVLKLLEKLA